MKVLMISLDKGLVGGKALGDVIERHRRYGEQQAVECLDIIVFTKKGYQPNEISDKVYAYPTNSARKTSYVRDALKVARDLFHTKGYDLVVTQDPYFTGKVGMRLRDAFDTKLLVHFHGDFWGRSQGLKERWYEIIFRGLSKEVVKRADAVRVMSVGQKRSLQEKGINSAKIKVISTPVDIERFINYPNSQAEDKQLNSLKAVVGGRKMILWVARRDKVKDKEMIERAMAMVIRKKGKDNVGLWVVGDYTARDFEPGIVSLESGSRRVSSKDMPANYYASYLVTSTSKSESFGKVMVEANACGRPVIATATVGAKEIVVDGYNGFLVPVGDADELANKIIYLLDNPDKADEMGENGRQRVREKFSDNTDKVINLWQEIVQKDA